MNRWKRRAALLAVLVGVGLLSLPALPTPTASASNVCYGRSGVYHEDPITGFAWTRDQVCPNAYGAPLYYVTRESPDLQTGTMLSTTSWFVCYFHGNRHAGGNDIWYFTQGDVADDDYPHDHAWGYMPAYYVWTNEDPDPGMPHCPW